MKEYHYYCEVVGLNCFEDYINSLGIITHKTFYNNESELTNIDFDDQNIIHIFRYHLPRFLIDKRPSDYAKRIFVLNTEQMSIIPRLHYILAHIAAGFSILDYSKENITILSKFVTPDRLFLIPYQYNEKEIEQLKRYSESPSIYDVGIVNCNTEHRRQVLRSLLADNIKVIDIRGWDAERDKLIGQCRILLNIHYEGDYQIFEHIRCDRWIFSSKKVISAKVHEPENIDVRSGVRFIDDFHLTESTELKRVIREELETPIEILDFSEIIIQRQQLLEKFLNA